MLDATPPPSPTPDFLAGTARGTHRERIRFDWPSDAAMSDQTGTLQYICCCWLVAYRPSNMLAYLRDGSAQTIVSAATLR